MLEIFHSIRLVIIERGGGEGHFIFVGSPAEIHQVDTPTSHTPTATPPPTFILPFQSVELSSFSPRSPLLPLRLPSQLSKLLRYISSISLALALLNVVPSYLLDGQHMVPYLLLLLIFSCSPAYTLTSTSYVTSATNASVSTPTPALLLLLPQVRALLLLLPLSPTTRTTTGRALTVAGTVTIAVNLVLGLVRVVGLGAPALEL